jgi:NAD(P)H-flavin reductase
MTQVGPVGSGGEPLTVMWTWRQRLDEEAQAKQQAQKPAQRRQSGERGENRRPKDSIAHEGPVDGPITGDQGHLAQLQARLRGAISDVPGVVRRLADVPQQQRTIVHSAIAANPAAAERGLAWLLEHLDQPSAVVAALGRLAPALEALIGPRGRQLDLFGDALIAAVQDARRERWSDEDAAAWRDGWRFAVGWLRQGAQLHQGETPFWTGTVLAHDRRREDVAVIVVGTDLPYPFRAGQRAIVECHAVPGVWRACWIGDPPAADNHIEIHVQAVPGDRATTTLVREARVGDPIRLHLAQGDFVIERGAGGSVLIVAEDVHVTPVKALLSELAERRDDRVVHVFWGVSTRDDLYDLASLREHATRCVHATVHAVVARGPSHPYLGGPLPQVVVDFGEWTSHEVYLSGSPLAVGVMRNMLLQRGVAPHRIHTVTLEPLGAA